MSVTKKIIFDIDATNHRKLIIGATRMVIKPVMEKVKVTCLTRICQRDHK